MTLADDVIVYPAHGAGSACGKNMSKETVSTIGNQKATNYALRANMTEAEFITEVTDGLEPPPAYFGMNVEMNKKGYYSFDAVLQHGMNALSIPEFESMANEKGVLILDTRNNNDFAKGFIPQSINIGLNGDFAPWVGAMIENVNQPIVLISEAGKEEETLTRLSRVGFDNSKGYLNAGFETWTKAGKEVDTINRITVDQFKNEVEIGKNKIIDIRKEDEYTVEHIEEAFNKPLENINNWIKDIDSKEHFYIHCASGYRSMIAASILQARGFRNFSEIEGGFNAIAKTDIPTTNFV